MSSVARNAAQAHRWILPLVACLVAGTPRITEAAAADEAPRRLLVRLPPDARPSPLVSYSGLGAASAPRAAALSIEGRPAVARLLSDRGAARFARLDEGFAAAPPEWRDLYVAEFDPPLSKESAHALVAELRSLDPSLSAEVDAVYEILVAPGFDWAGAVGGTGAPGSGAHSGRTGTDGSPPWETATRPAGFFPNDPLFGSISQWGLFNTGSGPFSSVPDLDVRAPEAWLVTTGNTSIVLGVVDTGIDPGHPDLVRPLADGRSRLLHRATVPRDGTSGEDSTGHGTQVWGVLAALTNDGATIGDLGMAGMMGGAGGDSAGARLVSFKVTIGRGTVAQSTDMARGIVEAHLLGARAVNLSFAGDEPSDALRSTLAFVAENGTIVVCGAGNTADSRTLYPGSYSRHGLTLAIGALAPDGTLAVFSTRGDQLDVVAPGQDIYSTWLTYENAYGSPLRNYAVNAGTSFAAPYVTGALGLAAALGADLVANDYQEVVRRTARDLGAPGRDPTFGNGLLNAAELLRRLDRPYSVVHGSSPARSWSFVGRESLSIRSSGITRGGSSVDGDYEAEVWEVRTRVDDPAAFLEPPEVWVRYKPGGGWSRVRLHEFNYTWGEALPGTVAEDGFDLRSYVYFIAAAPLGCSTCPPVGWVPRSPEQVVLEWSAWARVDSPPALAVQEPLPNDSWVAGEPRTVRWTASDPDQVSRVEIYWDAGGTSTLLATSQLPNGTVQVVAPCVSGLGPFALRVGAFDDHGEVPDRSEVLVPLELDGEPCATGVAFLASPMPNPSRSQVRFDYWVPAGLERASWLRILDSRGREVARLPIAAQAGPGQILWDGVGRDGTLSPSGIYFALFDWGSGESTQRFVWLR